MREVDAVAHDRRARGSDCRLDQHRRQRRHRARAAPPRHRDGVPELRPLSAHDDPPEPRLRAQGPEGAQGGRPPARRGGGRAPRPHGDARPQAGPALRRPAAARRDGARDRARAAGVPDGRAAVEPRCQAPGRDARLPGAAPRPPGRDDRLRHARSDGGDDPREAGCGAARRQGGAGGRAPGALRRAARTSSWRRSSARPR